MKEIPGGGSEAVRLARGEAVTLVNTHGSQVVDTWCVRAADSTEHLSVEHTRRMLFALFPREGDTLYSNRRTPLLTLETDTSGCRHDMLFACCDAWLYQFYGCAPGMQTAATISSRRCCVTASTSTTFPIRSTSG